MKCFTCGITDIVIKDQQKSSTSPMVFIIINYMKWIDLTITITLSDKTLGVIKNSKMTFINNIVDY